MRNIIVNGRIVNNAERKMTQSGKEYIQFRLANNEFGDPKDENGRPITYWFNVTSFDPFCVSIAKHLVKGKPINVTGRLREHIYANRTTGNCEISRDIDAKLIEFESYSGDQNNNGQQQNGNMAVPKTQTAIPTSSTTVEQSQKVEVPPAPVFNNGGKPDDDLPF